MSDVKKEDIDELISILAPLATGQASPTPGWVGGADRYKPPKGLLPEVKTSQCAAGPSLSKYNFGYAAGTLAVKCK